MANALLSADGILLRLGDRFSLALEHLEMGPGELLGVVGPNGSGKSTLLRVLAGLARPQQGRILLQGENLRSLAPREVARHIGYLPQERSAWEDLTVADLVERGLHPLTGLKAEARRRAVEAALDACGLSGLGGARLSRLSGGERQRAWLAFVVVRDPSLLLLDEPTAHLDYRHQAEVMGLVHRLSRQGKAAVVVLHDLWLAARCCYRLLVLSEGRPVAFGHPRDALSTETLAAVWGRELPGLAPGGYIVREV